MLLIVDVHFNANFRIKIILKSWNNCKGFISRTDDMPYWCNECNKCNKNMFFHVSTNQTHHIWPKIRTSCLAVVIAHHWNRQIIAQKRGTNRWWKTKTSKERKKNNSATQSIRTMLLVRRKKAKRCSDRKKKQTKKCFDLMVEML